MSSPSPPESSPNPSPQSNPPPPSALPTAPPSIPPLNPPLAPNSTTSRPNQSPSNPNTPIITTLPSAQHHPRNSRLPNTRRPSTTHTNSISPHSEPIRQNSFQRQPSATRSNKSIGPVVTTRTITKAEYEAEQRKKAEAKQLRRKLYAKTDIIYSPYSMRFFSLSNPIRRTAIAITSNRFFEIAMFLIVLVNCIMMALNPGPGDKALHTFSVRSEYFFIAIFVLEVILKLISLGLFSTPTGYFRDVWNILDFLVALFGLLSLTPVISNITPFRVIRVLRILITAKTIPGVKLFMTAVVSAIAALKDVGLLFLLYFFVVGLIGVSLFQGVLNYRCFDPVNQVFDESLLCYPGRTECPISTWECLRFDLSDRKQLMTYDNILFAIVTISTQISKSGWVYTFHDLTQVSTKWIVYIFIIPVLTLGMFYILNLITAVVFVHFEHAKQREYKRRHIALLVQLLTKKFEASEEKISQDLLKEAIAHAISQKRNNPDGGSNSTLGIQEDMIQIERDAIRYIKERITRDGRPSRFSFHSPSSQRFSLHSPIRASGGNLFGLNFDKNRGLNSPSSFRPPLVSIDRTKPHTSVSPNADLGLHHIPQRHMRSIIDIVENHGGEEHEQQLRSPATSQIHHPGQNNQPDLSRSPGHHHHDSKPLPPPPTLPGVELNSFGQNHGVENEPPSPHQQQSTPHSPLISSSYGEMNKSRLHFDNVPLTSSNTESFGISQAEPNVSRPSETKHHHHHHHQHHQEDTDKAAQVQNDDPSQKNQQAPSENDKFEAPTVSVGDPSHASESSWDSLSITATDFLAPMIPPTRSINWSKHFADETYESIMDKVRTVEEIRLGRLKKLLYLTPKKEYPCAYNHIFLPIRNFYYRFVVWPLFYVTSHALFSLFINLCVIVNVVLLCVNFWGIPHFLQTTIINITLAFSAVFIFEALLKIIALSPFLYFSDPFCQFDFFLVLVSVVDIILSALYPGTIHRIVAALRIFRLLRLLKSFPLLRKVLLALIQSGTDLFYFMGVVFCYMIIFAIVGMQFFSGKMKCPAELTGELVSCRLNFDNFPQALLLVFDIITGATWSEPLGVAVQGTSYWASIFFMVSLFLGNYCLLAIFISILLSHVDHDSESDAIQILYVVETLSGSLGDENYDPNGATEEYGNKLSGNDNFLTSEEEVELIEGLNLNRTQLITKLLELDALLANYQSKVSLSGKGPVNIDQSHLTLIVEHYKSSSEYITLEREILHLALTCFIFKSHLRLRGGYFAQSCRNTTDRNSIGFRRNNSKPLNIDVKNDKTDATEITSPSSALPDPMCPPVKLLPENFGDPDYYYYLNSNDNIEDLVLRGRLMNHFKLEPKQFKTHLKNIISYIRPDTPYAIDPLTQNFLYNRGISKGQLMYTIHDPDADLGADHRIHPRQVSHSRSTEDKNVCEDWGIELVQTSPQSQERNVRFDPDIDSNDPTHPTQPSPSPDQIEAEWELIQRAIDDRHDNQYHDGDDVPLHLTIGYYPYHVEEFQTRFSSLTGQLSLLGGLLKHKVRRGRGGDDDEIIDSRDKKNCCSELWPRFKKKLKWLFSLNNDKRYDVFCDKHTQTKVEKLKLFLIRKTLDTFYLTKEINLIQIDDNGQEVYSETESDDEDLFISVTQKLQSTGQNGLNIPQPHTYNADHFHSAVVASNPNSEFPSPVAAPQASGLTIAIPSNPFNERGPFHDGPPEPLMQVPPAEQLEERMIVDGIRSRLFSLPFTAEYGCRDPKETNIHERLELPGPLKDLGDNDIQIEPTPQQKLQLQKKRKRHPDHRISAELRLAKMSIPNIDRPLIQEELEKISNQDITDAMFSLHASHIHKSPQNESEPSDYSPSPNLDLLLPARANHANNHDPNLDSILIATRESHRDLETVNPVHSQRIARTYRNMQLYGQSFGFIPPDNPIRIYLARVLLWKWTIWFQVLLILFSAAIVAVQLSKPKASAKVTLERCELILIILFYIEIVSKMIVQGVIFNKGSFFRSPSNCLEFFINVLSTITYHYNSQHSSMSPLILVRGLRPLRLIDLIPQFRLVWVASLSAALQVIAVLPLAFITFLIFAVIGVALFGGALERCEVHRGIAVIEVLYGAAKDVCEQLMGSNPANPDLTVDTVVVWRNMPGFHFDNVIQSLLFLFHLSSFNMLPNILVQLSDSSLGPTAGPVRGESAAYGLPFVLIFCIICGFFIITLFTGIVVDEYQKAISRLTDSADLSQNQSLYLNLFKVISTVPIPMKLLPNRNALFGCCRKQRFDSKKALENVLNEMEIYTNNLSQEERDEACTFLSRRAAFNKNTHALHIDIDMPQDVEEKPKLRPNRAKSLDSLNRRNAAKKMASLSKKEFLQIGYSQVPLHYKDFPFEQVLSKHGLSHISRSNRYKRSSERKHDLYFNMPTPYMEVKIRNFFFSIAQHAFFKYFSLFVIILNALVLALEYHGADKTMNQVLGLISDICTWYFCLEVCIKLIGFGVEQYLFNDNIPLNGESKHWSRFDVFIVICSVIPLCMQYADGTRFSENGSGFAPSIFRVLRIFRLFRLSRQFYGVEIIINTLLYSLPSLGSLAFILLCVLFSYAILGVILFKDVRYGPDLNSAMNFRTFPEALWTLFAMLTGEFWNNTMSSLMVQPPLCSYQVGDCGSPIWAPVYIVSFVCIVTYVILNIFVAIVVNSYSDQVQEHLADIDDLAAHKALALDEKRITKEDRKLASAKKTQHDPNANPLTSPHSPPPRNTPMATAAIITPTSPSNHHPLIPTCADIDYNEAVIGPELVVQPTGDCTDGKDVDFFLNATFNIKDKSLSNNAVRRFIYQWGMWRAAQIATLWATSDQFEISQQIAQIVQDKQLKTPQPNPDLSFNNITTSSSVELSDHAYDLISYLYGEKSHRPRPDVKFARFGASISDYKHTSMWSFLKSFISPSSSSTTPGDMARDPIWMDVRSLLLFLNWAEAPLGFRNSPLSSGDFIKLLSMLNIRQFNGYVHFAEIAVAITQTLFTSEVRQISLLNRVLFKNRVALLKLYPNLKILNGCTINAGLLLAIIKVQRLGHVMSSKLASKKTKTAFVDPIIKRQGSPPIPTRPFYHPNNLHPLSPIAEAISPLSDPSLTPEGNTSGNNSQKSSLQAYRMGNLFTQDTNQSLINPKDNNSPRPPPL